MKQTEVNAENDSTLQNVECSTGLGKPVSLITEIGAGREIADVFMAYPPDNNTKDLEGEEASPDSSDEDLTDINLRCVYGTRLTFH